MTCKRFNLEDTHWKVDITLKAYNMPCMLQDPIRVDKNQLREDSSLIMSFSE